MQQPQTYIERLNALCDTVDAANVGGTTDDCVLALTTVGIVGTGIVNDSSAANGIRLRITKKGTYVVGCYLDLAAHADTDLTLAFTMNTDAAGLTSTPTNATTGILGRIRRAVLPAALAITNLCWDLSKPFHVTDAQAHATNLGGAAAGAVIRIILAGAVADTHPTANVVGAAANWGCYLYRVNDING